MAESYQEKLKRVRKPRVHITYDVETEGARVVKELPFIMGVVGDFSGQPTQALPSTRAMECASASCTDRRRWARLPLATRHT